MDLTDLEEITQAIENGHLYQYITTEDSQLVEEAEHEMYITQPLTQIIDNNVQIINNGIQILDETNQVVDSNLQVGLDNGLDVQVVASDSPIMNEQHIDNMQIVNNSYQIIENSSGPVENGVQILTSNGHILSNEGQIIENLSILDKNVKILDTKNQIINKNIQKFDNNIKSSIKMETDLNETETKGGVINFIYQVVYPEQLNLQVCFKF